MPERLPIIEITQTLERSRGAPCIVGIGTKVWPGDDHPGAVVLLEVAHRSQPRLQPAMVGLDPIVGVPLGSVPRRG